MAQINTPKEVLALAQKSATGKMQLPAGKTLLLAFLAGAYIAMGGLFSLMAGFGFPGASGRMTVALERGETRELNFEVAQSGISMDEVVVSASRSETLRREAPALVSVLDAGLFERANASCLAQGLSFQPGVRVEDDCQLFLYV